MINSIKEKIVYNDITIIDCKSKDLNFNKRYTPYDDKPIYNIDSSM